jgi:hypothetical protein
MSPQAGERRRNRSCEMSDSEIMTVSPLFRFGTFKNFKHFHIRIIPECIRARNSPGNRRAIFS